MKQKELNKKQDIFRASALAFVTAMLMLLVSCEADKIGQQPTHSNPPPPVTNVVSEPTPGGAIISYDIPNRTDISYVICEYTIKGVQRVARSSIYTNQITIEGLGEIAPCAFTLYMVDHSENRSQPYKGTFTPLEPPYLTIFKSLTGEPDFGGARMRWENENRDLIGAFLLAVNDAGEWTEFDLAFSTMENDSRAIRGYDASPRMFGAILMDRWGNRTDTFKVVVEPWLEKQLEKRLFRDAYLLGDNNSVNGGRPLSNIWNGTFGDGTANLWHTVAGDPSGVPPQHFTINLGVEANLSRMMWWGRAWNNSFTMAQHDPRLIEVWGCKHDVYSEYSPLDAHWRSAHWQDNWTFLGDFEVVKPSGLPVGQSTEEDRELARNGFEFVFEPGVGAIQYLRFRIKETFTRSAAIHMTEISIFGNDGTE